VEVAKVPVVRPEGVLVPAVNLLKAFIALRPFVCADEGKPHLCGILLSGESAFATNNVALVEHWLGIPFPVKVNVPVSMVDEMIRAKVEPSTIQIAEGSVTAHYTDGRWIKSQVNVLEWPNAAEVLSRAWVNTRCMSIRPDLIKACAKLATQEVGLTKFSGSEISTANGTAVVTVPAPDKGVYHTQHLAQVLGAAQLIDFDRYPLPVPFSAGELRGVLLGVRQ